MCAQSWAIEKNKNIVASTHTDMLALFRATYSLDAYILLTMNTCLWSMFSSVSYSVDAHRFKFIRWHMKICVYFCHHSIVRWKMLEARERATKKCISSDIHWVDSMCIRIPLCECTHTCISRIVVFMFAILLQLISHTNRESYDNTCIWLQQRHLAANLISQ